MNCIVLDYGKTLCDSDWDSVGGQGYFYKLYYCLDGKAEYTCQGEYMEFVPKKLYIIKENSPYKIVAKKGGLFNVLWFHVDFYLPLIKSIIEIEIEDESLEFYLIKSLESAIVNHTEILQKIIEALSELIVNNNDLLKVYDKPIVRAAEYITQNYNKNITNDIVANELGYNKNYFIKKFKDTLGISPHKYLIKVKMTFARKYLLESKSVRQVSEMIGYTDPNTFSRDFKKYYGISPTSFVKTFESYI